MRVRQAKAIRPINPTGRVSEREVLRRKAAALAGVLSSLYGQERLSKRAERVGARAMLNSPQLGRRVLALQRLVFDDPNLNAVPREAEIPAILEDLQERIADLMARKSIEDEIERRVQDRMKERQDEYLRAIRMQVMQDALGPETESTRAKLEELQRLEEVRLARTALEALRPRKLSQVVGQERAIRALLAKLAVPIPQHVILYGPPGVGKTTVARLVLEEAKRLPQSPFGPQAPFIEVDASTLRWDAREATNPLLGSVHDPIYQGSRREFAELGIPEPKLGLVTRAHGGVLFIDEIGELDAVLQAKLLKVLEDKRVFFESSYYDPTNPQLPAYIKRLFTEGAPADFLLIGATTKEPEEISPTLRSRCAEVFFDPLSQEDVQKIVRQAARRLGVELEAGVPETISEYTVEGRKAVNLLADAYGVALYRRRGRGHPRITRRDLLEVVRSGRLTATVPTKASDVPEVGKVFALGVTQYVGSLIEIEAVAFPVGKRQRGTIRFNETAGTMAKDSVFNAASVIRRIAGIDVGNYDIHVNVVGGGLIDGPSAGLAVVLAMLSAIQRVPVRQDVAVTGEISIQGKVKQVGGIPEKIYGARQAGMRKVVLPEENRNDVPAGVRGIEVVFVATVEDALPHLFPSRYRAHSRTPA
ncbi:MAG: Lon family ATP-dependent protease [Armatimonadota bacterium]|nr:Lon family ATP-dependent protease [Armatimonadota bacterium]MDR7450934.1 Lon family ATP-dependent protease [Armatimonadota bacterium]MDR7465856.1 Lon family ATP-dependent protease [Armatimonadota bacterium]MDR7493764.1 Lon family ATP-dependent protease [Armatimonadota bacterium]MDR7498370.1 Lon family ATP-dependent protease [Armatimonadota bacterium]